MDFLIRPIRVEDADEIARLRRMPGVMENTLGIPSDTEKRAQEVIANMDRNMHRFVAVTKNEKGKEQIIGDVALSVGINPRIRHTGYIGIMVHKDYQNKGVGSALLETVLNMADEWLMLVRVELGVFPDNERAIHLYKKYGFEEEGIKRKAIIRKGEYVDEMIMARIK